MTMSQRTCIKMHLYTIKYSIVALECTVTTWHSIFFFFNFISRSKWKCPIEKENSENTKTSLWLQKKDNNLYAAVFLLVGFCVLVRKHRNGKSSLSVDTAQIQCVYWQYHWTRTVWIPHQFLVWYFRFNFNKRYHLLGRNIAFCVDNIVQLNDMTQVSDCVYFQCCRCHNRILHAIGSLISLFLLSDKFIFGHNFIYSCTLAFWKALHVMQSLCKHMKGKREKV